MTKLNFELNFHRMKAIFGHFKGQNNVALT